MADHPTTDERVTYGPEGGSITVMETPEYKLPAPEPKVYTFAALRELFDGHGIIPVLINEIENVRLANIEGSQWVDCAKRDIERLTADLALAQGLAADRNVRIAMIAYERDCAVEKLAELRKMLDGAHTALLGFVTTYNGNPTRFREAEKATGEELDAAYEKLDAFLYPPQDDVPASTAAPGVCEHGIQQHCPTCHGSW